MRVKDETVPFAFQDMVVCPYPDCGAREAYRTKKTNRSEADGAYSRDCTCQKCNRRFVLVISPPEPTDKEAAKIWGNEISRWYDASEGARNEKAKFGTRS